MSILSGSGSLLQPMRPAAHEDEPDSLTDMSKARQRLFDHTLTAAQGLEPLANSKHTLKLTDVHYSGPDEYSLKDQKKAILTGDTLGRTLKGTFQLLDNVTGQLVDQKRVTLANVPYRTDRGTFIHNGTEYAVRNQMRLLPGVFTRIRGNGEIEAHTNVMPGKGLSHRYFLDPDKGVFYIRVAQSKTPLVSLLTAMGVTHHQLRDAWGPELAATNLTHNDPADVKKLAGKFLPRIPENQTEAHTTEQLVNAFQAMELDPEVTKRTLGHPFTNVGPETILRTTQKLLQLQKGEVEPDDRDHLAYQKIMAPEDLFSERIRRDAGNIRRQLLFKASQRGNLQGIGSRPFQKQLNSVILTSGVGTGLEETSPLELLDKMSTITSMGVGGLPSTTAIPLESRAVQPSHLGFMDPLKTPESEAAGVILNIAGQVRRKADGQLAKQFTNLHTGQLEWRTPQDVADSAIAFPGEMAKPGKRIIAMLNGKLQYVSKADVKYELPHFEHVFSDVTNLVPMKSALKGQRAVMGARMLTQALPLENPEAPFVQSAVPGTGGQKSFDEHFGGFMGAVRAKQGGQVTAVSPEAITVKHDDGTTQNYELYDSFPFNRRSRLHNTPMVQPGQRVGPDDLLAKSNFTNDNGAIAIGKNAYIGYMPYGAGTYEDAQLVSESFAKKLRSEHLYQHDATWGDALDKKGKAPYVSLFPSKFDRKQLDTIDEDGVVKPGTVVDYGHPLILLAKGREHSQSKVHRKGQLQHTDASVTWSYNSPGIVRDVVKTDKGPMVTVTSMRSTQESDKLSDRFGAKGVIGKILSDDLMPRDSTGRPFDMLLNPAGIPSRLNPVKIHEATLGKIAEKTGKPYKIEDFSNIADLRAFVEQEAQKHGVPDTETVFDPGTNRYIPGVKTGVQWIMKLHHIAEDKEQGRGASGGYTLSGVPAKGGDGESS
jgi:DNA-directed RNA polymerase subunit beta